MWCTTCAHTAHTHAPAMHPRIPFALPSFDRQVGARHFFNNNESMYRTSVAQLALVSDVTRYFNFSRGVLRLNYKPCPLSRFGPSAVLCTFTSSMYAAHLE